MIDKSKIEWTDFTWNPWYGCHKVSAGCKNCYMFRDSIRYNKDRDPNVVMRGKTTMDKPLKIKKPSMIFTCSWSDFFIEEADEWRSEAWEIIKQTPHHTYQILTKRPLRVADNIPADGIPKNVWLGVSVEQAAYFDRIEQLKRMTANIRFISYEPLINWGFDYLDEPPVPSLW
ncbi:MAG TPA: DUF5131 family protein [bacterium]|nr:DUF5131 family protein [bacterium]